MDNDKQQRVVVTDLDISFGNLVMLWIKIAVAAIPAVGILALVFAMLTVVFGSLIKQ